jgi:nucleotide-binding universal stress UspA family protein
MYKNVLAAVNQHTNSEVAARYAVSFARSCGARLTLMFAVPEGVEHEVLRRAESALGRLFEEAELAGVEVESVIAKGDPVEKIRAHVKEGGVDIVFAATRHEDVHRRFFVRTVARELMLRLPCAVVMTRVVRMERARPRKILVPLRGREPGLPERAEFVARLAQGFDAEVTLFHTPRPLTGFFRGEVHVKPAQMVERIPADVEEFTRQLEKSGVPHEKRAVHGAVARTITTEAALKRSDLIVMGASQRSLLATLIAGDPVEEVLRETPCSLMIFRPSRRP